jgi:aspartate--ammonia ligase
VIKRYIEDNLCKELNLSMAGAADCRPGQRVNDYLDRDGSRTPVEFPVAWITLVSPPRWQANKWKRMALAQFDCKVGEEGTDGGLSARIISRPRP